MHLSQNSYRKSFVWLKNTKESHEIRKNWRAFKKFENLNNSQEFFFIERMGPKLTDNHRISESAEEIIIRNEKNSLPDYNYFLSTLRTGSQQFNVWKKFPTPLH